MTISLLSWNREHRGSSTLFVAETATVLHNTWMASKQGATCITRTVVLLSGRVCVDTRIEMSKRNIIFVRRLQLFGHFRLAVNNHRRYL